MANCVDENRLTFILFPLFMTDWVVLGGRRMYKQALR